jgi:hypothetical protein
MEVHMVAGLNYNAYAQAFTPYAISEEQSFLFLQAPYTLSPTGSGPIAPENPAVLVVGNATETAIALLNPSNNSGVSGEAIVHINQQSGTVSLDVVASGLTPGQVHPQHIHGFDNGQPSLLPNLTLDTNNDGLVEDPEGAPVVGPVLLAGHSSGAVDRIEVNTDYPTADASGNLRFHQDYHFNLADPAQAQIFQELEQRIAGREFQIHGLTVAPGQDSTLPPGGYDPSLPVANGAFVPVVDENTAGVARLYEGLLDRAPDLQGLVYWATAAQSGASAGAIAQAFLFSPEYQALHTTPLTNAQFVSDLYENALDRAPDTAGLQFWTDALAFGTSRAQVALGIAESPEAQQHLPLGVQDVWHII